MPDGKVAAAGPTSPMICCAESTPNPGTSASRCTAGWCWWRSAANPVIDGQSLRDFDVGRLQIAMDDALFVRRLERVGHLKRELERVVNWKWSALQALVERVALDQFHHEEVRRLP